jgi:NitT/TauT family transport system permease protein
MTLWGGLRASSPRASTFATASGALRIRRVRRSILGVVVVLGAAELASLSGLVDPTLIPAPTTVVASAGNLVANGAFLADVAATLGVWVEAIAIAVAIAVPLGMVLGAVPWLEAAARPVLEFLRPIPSVTLIPLVLLVLHNDVRTQVAVVVYASLWPVLINTMYGLRDVDPLAKQTLRSFGFTPAAVLRRVSLPSAAPFIATGVRLAASIGFVVAIGAELIGGGVNGIGVFLIQTGSGAGHTDQLLAATIWAGLFGLAVNALLTRLERRAFPWHHARAREGA